LVQALEDLVDVIALIRDIVDGVGVVFGILLRATRIILSSLILT
jgi:hypothetical protein